MDSCRLNKAEVTSGDFKIAKRNQLAEVTWKGHKYVALIVSPFVLKEVRIQEGTWQLSSGTAVYGLVNDLGGIPEPSLADDGFISLYLSLVRTSGVNSSYMTTRPWDAQETSSAATHNNWSNASPLRPGI